MTAEASVSETVGGYRVHRVIAEGGVATVREAAHLTLGCAGHRRGPRNGATIVEELRDEMARVAEAASARVDELDGGRPHRCE